MLAALIFISAIYLGFCLGGIGVGFAGAMGVAALLMLGTPICPLPVSLFLMLFALTVVMSAFDEAGGVNAVIQLGERLLQRTGRLGLFAPLLSYALTIVSGTGYLFFFLIPPLIKLSQQKGYRPVDILPTAAVASQLAVVASPLSACFLFLVGLLAPYGISRSEIMAILFPSTLVAVVCTALWFTPKPPKACSTLQSIEAPISLRTKLVLLLMAAALVLLLFIPRDIVSENLYIAVLFPTAGAITLLAGYPINRITRNAFFVSGCNAMIALLGMGWLGATFFQLILPDLPVWLSTLLRSCPVILPLLTGVSATLLYSQSVAAQSLFPAALQLGLPPSTLLGSAPALCCLFLLPNYPTTLAVVEMDTSGSMHSGKHPLSHPFLWPSLFALFLALMFSFTLSSFFLTVGVIPACNLRS